MVVYITFLKTNSSCQLNVVSLRCRAFTPDLAKWYKTIKKGPNADNFEIVFVSSDRDEESWKEYFNEMPWKALQYSDRDKKVPLFVYHYSCMLIGHSN